MRATHPSTCNGANGRRRCAWGAICSWCLCSVLPTGLPEMQVVGRLDTPLVVALSRSPRLKISQPAVKRVELFQTPYILADLLVLLAPVLAAGVRALPRLLLQRELVFSGLSLLRAFPHSHAQYTGFLNSQLKHS